MVTRVWGKADSFELVFSPLDALNEQWEAHVPADIEDGQYAVELYCTDGSNIVYWTGMLYLNRSETVQLRIVADAFRLWFEVDSMNIQMEAESELVIVPETQVILLDTLQVWLEDERIALTCSVDRG